MSITVNPAAIQELMSEIPVGDIILFEKATGHTFASLAALQHVAQRGTEGAAIDVPFEVMLGMAWLFKRRSDPTVTWEQATQWTLAELSAVLNPTSAEPLTKLDTPKRRGTKAA